MKAKITIIVDPVGHREIETANDPRPNVPMSDLWECEFCGSPIARFEPGWGLITVLNDSAMCDPCSTMFLRTPGGFSRFVGPVVTVCPCDACQANY